MNLDHALRLMLHQHTAVYRNPTTSEIVETYPLVPPSTVLGMLSTLLKKELKSGDIDISIQGDYDTVFRDFQWHKKYDEVLSKTTQKEEFYTYPLLLHSLYDVNMIIHIMAGDDILQKLETIFKNPPFYPYLGRAEDLIKIKSVEIINVKKETTRGFDLKYSAYIPLDISKKFTEKGILYRLATFLNPVYLTVKNGKKQETRMVRDFIWRDYVYLEKDTWLEADDVPIEILNDGEYHVWPLCQI